MSLVDLEIRRLYVQDVLTRSSEESRQEIYKTTEDILKSKGVDVSTYYQPQLGVDYDEIIEIRTYKELDDVFMRVRNSCGVQNLEGKNFDELFNVKPLDCFPNKIDIALDDRSQYIGWLITDPDGKRHWVKMSMNSIKAEYFNKNKND